MKASKTTIALALTAVGAAGIAYFAGNPFKATELSQGYEASGTEKTAEGKCGGAKDAKTAEGKCGGAKDAKTAEGKCGEGKCGGAKEAKAKATEGKCGEGKCGGAK